MPLPLGIARQRFGPGRAGSLREKRLSQGQFPPTGALRFGAGAGLDGLVSTSPVGFNVHTVWGWFRFRQSQVGLSVQMSGASLESVAPDTAGPYQLLFESTFGTNTVELHDNVNGGFLFTPTMAPMEWWFIASTNNFFAQLSGGQTTFYARRMGDSSAMTAITGNKHPFAQNPTRFLIGTDDAGSQNEWWDGDICGIGVANREYSLAEIDAQSRQLYPVSRLGLHAFYPLTETASMLLDASGKQRHLAPIVTGGSWSVVDGPQIPIGNFEPLAADQGPVPLHVRAPFGLGGHRSFTGPEKGFRPFRQADTAVLADTTLAAAVAGSSALTAALTTSITPAASVAGSSTLTAALTTSITAAAAVSGSTVDTAALTTAIAMAAAVAGSSVLTAALTANSGINFAAAVAGSSSLTAALSTSITLAAAVSGSSTLTAALTTAITTAAAVSGSSSPTAALSTSITPAAAVAGSSVLSAALTTAITPAASVAGSSALTAALTTQITLAAAVSGSSTLTASLAVGAGMSAAVSGSSVLTAALSTSITPAAAVSGSSSLTAALSTAITPAAAVSGSSTLTAALSTSIRLAGAVSGSSALSASLSTSIAAAAAVSGSSTLTAALSTAIRFSAALAASSLLTADLSAGFFPGTPLQGELLIAVAASDTDALRILNESQAYPDVDTEARPDLDTQALSTGDDTDAIQR